MTNPKITAILSEISLLQKLYVNDAKLSAADLQELFQAIQAPQYAAIKEINLNDLPALEPAVTATLATALAALPQLETVRIYRSNLSNEAFANIAPVLPSIKKLKQLNLYSCNLRRESGDALAAILPQCKALHEFALTCYWGDNSLKPALFTALQTCPELTALGIHGSGFDKSVIAATLPYLPKLQILNLSSLSLGDDNAIAILKALRHCTVLASLFLGNTNVTDKFAKVLSQLLPSYPSITTIRLHDNKFTTNAAFDLARALPYCKQLQLLGLRGNKINTAGVNLLRAIDLQLDNGLEIEVDDVIGLPGLTTDQLYYLRQVLVSTVDDKDDDLHLGTTFSQLLPKIRADQQLDLNEQLSAALLTVPLIKALNPRQTVSGGTFAVTIKDGRFTVESPTYHQPLDNLTPLPAMQYLRAREKGIRHPFKDGRPLQITLREFHFTFARNCSHETLYAALSCNPNLAWLSCPGFQFPPDYLYLLTEPQCLVGIIITGTHLDILLDHLSYTTNPNLLFFMFGTTAIHADYRGELVQKNLEELEKLITYLSKPGLLDADMQERLHQRAPALRAVLSQKHPELNELYPQLTTQFITPTACAKTLAHLEHLLTLPPPPTPSPTPTEAVGAEALQVAMSVASL